MNNDKTVSYRMQVLNFLKKDIIARKIVPGDILNERKLALEYVVSRTPVREAIQILEQEGWLKVVPWKGAIVLPVTIADVKETFQLRMAIEPMAIELALPKLTDDNINDLINLYEKQKEFADGKDPEEFISIDQDFHLYLAEFSENTRLYKILKQYQDIHKRIGIEAVQKQERNIETIREHEQLLRVIKKRDVEKAKEAMREHLTKSLDVMLYHLQEIQRRNNS